MDMIPKPTFKYEFNLTTIVAVVGLVGTVVSMTNQFSRMGSRVEVLEVSAANWRAEHMNFHRDRATEVASNNARLDERLRAVEGSIKTIDNMSYRLTVQEQGTTSLSAAVAELRQTITNVTGDIRLIREIVTRIEDREPDQPKGASR